MTNVQNPAIFHRKPKRIQWLKWLRRTHAWVGLWGAALGLLFGASGILLNHRMVMKIPAAKMDMAQIELALSEPLPTDVKALAKWLQVQLSIDREPHKIFTEPSKTVTWNGQNVEQPGQWRVEFHSPQ